MNGLKTITKLRRSAWGAIAALCLVASPHVIGAPQIEEARTNGAVCSRHFSTGQNKAERATHKLTAALSLSETRSGRIGGAIRPELARVGYGQSSRWGGLPDNPCSRTDASGLDCSSLRKIEVDAEDAARRIRRHGQGSRVGSSRSSFHNIRSAMAIAARSDDPPFANLQESKRSILELSSVSSTTGVQLDTTSSITCAFGSSGQSRNDNGCLVVRSKQPTIIRPTPGRPLKDLQEMPSARLQL